MPTFAVPYSSSPPSTPGSNQRPKSSFNLADNPSTTPAGPPPSASNSFTPAGFPTSTVFGSSQLGPAKSLFSARTQEQSARPSNPTNGKPNATFFTQPKSQTAKVPLNDITQSSLPQGQADGDQMEDEDHDADGEDEDDTDMDVENGHNGPAKGLPTFGSSIPYDWAAHGSSTRDSTPRGSKRQPVDLHAPSRGSLLNTKNKSLIRQRESTLPTIAKDLTGQIGPAELYESDTLILQTEETVNKMYDANASPEDQDRILAAALEIVPEALSKIWQSCCKEEYKHEEDPIDYTETIGPDEEAPALEKATFIGTLMLKLYQPPPTKGRHGVGSLEAARRSVAHSLGPNISRQEAYPKVLIDWLDASHNPYRRVATLLKTYQPNPVAHVNFWDVVHSATLRGQLGDVLQIFERCDFEYAATAKEDGMATKGYRGSPLQNIRRAIGQATRILESCPALKDGDWHVTRSDWMLFRKRVEATIEELSSFAEGENYDQSIGESAFQAENFGIRNTTSTLSQSARRAQSKVPWTVYQNLKLFYGILLGGTEELLQLAQDWLEASLSFAIWWDGNEEEVGVGSASTMTRSRSLRRSQGHSARTVDSNPGAAYRRRLLHAFEKVTEDETLTIDTSSPVEVALASLLEGNLDNVFDFLRVWSLPVTAAVMEVASEGNWYDPAVGQATSEAFDESDLMVLSYGETQKALTKDNVLIDYAESLFERDELRYGAKMKEGWEVSLDLLAKIDDQKFARKKIGEYLESLTVETNERADKLIDLCREYELHREARDVAEKYADTVAETTDSYGTALTYYARAHNHKKVKDVLDLLVSFCLVQSVAYPPANSLDPHLKVLLLKPRESISQLAADDEEAAEILSEQLSGYATVRKFYEIRDEETKSPGKSAQGSLSSRKRKAVTALLTVIASAADNIQGGLLDAENPAVVPVDGLLVLLGEASAFVNQSPSLLSLPQTLILLRAIEDLEAVHPRIRQQCAECFSSALASAHGAPAPDPRDLMRKSISDLTASTGFSLVGGSMISGDSRRVRRERSRSKSRDGRSGSGDERGRKRKRGWDWREGAERDEKPGRMLKRLRLGLAREVAGLWVEG